MDKTDLKLNLGSGYKKYPGYINVDGDVNCNPDYLINLDDINLHLPFGTNSVTRIICSHVLEHIGDGFFKLLQEIYRVCKPGAIIDITVPHPHHDCQLIDPTHKRFILPETFRLFSKKHNQLEIERGGSSSTLALMFDVDFEIVEYQFIHDSFYDNIIKNNTLEQNARLLREALNTTIETKTKLVVIK